MISVALLQHPHLCIQEWDIQPGDSWVVLGRNAAGKQYVDQLLRGELTGFKAQRLTSGLTAQQVQLVSFEEQQAIYERELKLAANDMISDEESATKARDFLPADATNNELLSALGLTHRLDAPYYTLSTGESRKLLIAKAILEGAELLILDNPFDSLDTHSCDALGSALKSISKQGVTMVLMLSNRQDIPTWCQLGATLVDGQLSVIGRLDDAQTQQAFDALFAPETMQPEWPDTAMPLTDYPHSHLIALKACTVSFGGKTVLNSFNFEVEPLQHTLITGENGAGKSTLLGLITGDCPQCYSNDVTVLGHQRGSGESVWDIKQMMGIVSSDLHRRYRVRCNLLTVVCSGFFDSIGVYEPLSDHQKNIAEQWLAAAGLAGRGKEGFQSLSYGEQRLALIARALVKSPLLLILDEPTQGLDEINRSRIMNLLETLDRRRHSTVIFVSHRADERLPLFRQHVHLVRQAN